MDNGSRNPQHSSTQPYSTPDASLVVFAGDKSTGRYATPLNKTTDGTHVIAAGTVHDAREHGTIDTPRATLQLINDLGQATYAAADAETLAAYSLFLMDGVEVSLHGIARQPFPADPRTTYIQIVRVEPLFS